jgi:hypothetical protein
MEGFRFTRKMKIQSPPGEDGETTLSGDEFRHIPRKGDIVSTSNIGFTEMRSGGWIVRRVSIEYQTDVKEEVHKEIITVHTKRTDSDLFRHTNLLKKHVRGNFERFKYDMEPAKMETAVSTASIEDVQDIDVSEIDREQLETLIDKFDADIEADELLEQLERYHS